MKTWFYRKYNCKKNPECIVRDFFIRKKLNYLILKSSISDFAFKASRTL